MAYSWTAETELVNLSGHPREFRVKLYETDAEATSEWVIGDADGHGDPCPFKTARLISYRAARISGTGATVDPVVGRASGQAGLDHIWSNGSAGALIEQKPDVVILFKETLGNLIYGKSTINAGTNSIIHTEIVFIEGAA